MRKVNVLYSMVFMITLFGVSVNHLNACTRVVYQGDNNMIITGRTMDWKEDTRSNIWIFPRGMERNGEVGKDPMRWKSKYGSVITSAYDICSTDGMNEKGLVANLLWLAESSYPQWNGERPALSIAAWVQYMLDNFATVDEAVAEVEKNTFDVVSDMMPDGTRMATLHLSIFLFHDSITWLNNIIKLFINSHSEISWSIISIIFRKTAIINTYISGNIIRINR